MILSKKNIYLMYHQKKKEVINMKGEEFLKAVDLLEKEKKQNQNGKEETK